MNSGSKNINLWSYIKKTDIDRGRSNKRLQRIVMKGGTMDIIIRKVEGVENDYLAFIKSAIISTSYFICFKDLCCIQHKSLKSTSLILHLRPDTRKNMSLPR